MAHVAKYSKTACGHMCSHYDRSANNIGNEKIDYLKTVHNYNLAPERDISQMDYINKRCSEVKCLNRKDVNVMCSWVITVPKDLPCDDENKFFNESYKFLTKRYGGEKNVISAHVHVDETQPHMHFAFIPVVKDKKTNLDKVSAKECITKSDLKSFHTDLDRHMEDVFGRNIGILNQATRDGNRSIKELKRKSASERLWEVKQITQKKINNTNKTLKDASQKLSKVHSSINLLVERKNALEEQIKAIESKLKTLDGEKYTRDKVLSVKPIANIPLNKEKAIYLKSDIENLKKTATQRAEVDEETKTTQEENKRLKKKVNNLLSSKKQLEIQLQESKAQANISITEKIEIMKLKKQLQDVPKHDLDNFLAQYIPQKKKSRQKDYGER